MREARAFAVPITRNDTLGTAGIGADSALATWNDLVAATSVRRVCRSIVGSVETTLHGRAKAVRLWLLDRSGRLRLASGPPVSVSPKDLRASRLLALRTREPASIIYPEAVRAVVEFPLTHRGEALGILEVDAQDATPMEVRDSVQAIALVGSAAVAWHRERNALRREIGELNRETQASQDTEQRSEIAVALAAHELRAPLFGALAAIERLMLGRASNESIEDLLRQSHVELLSLSGALDKTLEWATRPTPALTRVDLAGLVREVARSMSAVESGRRRIEVEANEACPVSGDEAYLSVAIANLVRNALEYSPTERPVFVRVRGMGPHAEAAVFDEGPGVPPTEREAIFQPFVRGQAGRKAGRGSGLGLFIARRAVESHGGRIWVESNGHGSAFKFAIPRLG